MGVHASPNRGWGGSMRTTGTKAVMNVLRRGAVLAAALLATLFGALQAAGKDLQVVATTAMIADAARHVGGDQVTVKALMGPGVDPHAYRQTRTDIVALTGADLVLWHGLYLEAQLEDFMRALAKKRTVVAVGEAVPRDLLIRHDDYQDKYDPHVWMSPELWKHVVVKIRDVLIKARPQAEPTFRANAEAHLSELSKLAEYTNKALASVPSNSRVLLTAHDAFNYFGMAYGFEVVGIQGISTESEAGLRRISELVKLLVERRIKSVFVESSVSDRNVRALVEGAAAKGHRVAIGGELFSDAMGQPGTYEGTYVGMIDHNTTVISRALGGQAPAKGMQGKLS